MTDPGQTALPPEADFLRETIKVVEWQRDNARQERNEEHARASAAEAEVAKLTRGLLDIQHEVTDHAMRGVKTNQRAEVAEATVSALRDRVAVLEEALTSLAIEGASGVYVWPGPDGRGVTITMPGAFGAARAALTPGGENAKA